MTIEETLEALKEAILSYFPTVQNSDDNKKIKFIRQLQEYLAEILLQMKRTLERYEPENKEHQPILADFASFCIAFSLAGKSGITLALQKHVINEELHSSLDLVFKKIYDTHSYLAPEQPLSSADYEKGLCQQYRCCDLIGEGAYRFIPRKEEHLFTTITTMNKDHNYKIQNTIIMLDPSYDTNAPSYSGVPLNPELTTAFLPSAEEKNDTMSKKTEKLFSGLFLNKKEDKEKSLEKPSSPQNSSRSNSSSSDSTESGVPVTLIRGCPFSKPRQLRFVVKKEDSQSLPGLFFTQKHTLGKQYSAPSKVIFTKRTP